MFLYDAVIAMMSEALCVVERESLLLCETVFSAKTRILPFHFFAQHPRLQQQFKKKIKKIKKKEKHQSSDVRTPMGYVK